MDRVEVRLQARELVGQTVDMLAARGVVLPDALKRRDPREPKRREKEVAEDRLSRWVLRHWSRQRRHVREVLEEQATKQATLSDPLGDVDEDDLVSLQMILRDGAAGGIDLFAGATNLGFDVTSSKTRAYDWALDHSSRFLQLLDTTSQQAVRKLVSQFIATPGMTIADVMELLPFGEERALRVAVTEITGAYAQGQLLAGQEMRAEFPGVKVVEYWFTNMDERVCEICSELEGESVELGNIFPSSVIGGVEKPPAHVNCLTGDALVSPIGGVAATSERHYEGEVVAIYAAGHDELTCTPNHPVLTRRGWVPAGLLQEGDQVVCRAVTKWVAGADADNQDVPARIEEVAHAFGRFSNVVSREVPLTAEDFHGDGRGSKVTVVRADGLLRNRFDAETVEHLGELALGQRDVSLSLLSGSGTGDLLGVGSDAASGGSVGGGNLPGTSLVGHVTPLHGFGLRLSADRNAGLQEAIADRPAIDAEIVGYGLLGLAGEVTLCDVVRIERKSFAGHVYNLQTEFGIYSANGIITHNCRCWLETTTEI